MIDDGTYRVDGLLQLNHRTLINVTLLYPSLVFFIRIGVHFSCLQWKKFLKKATVGFTLDCKRLSIKLQLWNQFSFSSVRKKDISKNTHTTFLVNGDYNSAANVRNLVKYLKQYVSRGSMETVQELYSGVRRLY